MPKLTDAVYKSEITETGYVIGYQDGVFCRWLASLFEGSTWHSLSGVPSSSLGVNDDFCLDTLNADIYQKISGAWSLLLNIKGADGSNGTNGIDGIGIPSGGTAGQVLSKSSSTNYDTQWTDQSITKISGWLTLSGTQSIPSSTMTKIALNTSSNVVGSITCDTTNNKITIQATGIYLFCCSIEYVSGTPSLAGAGVSFGVYKNGVSFRILDCMAPTWSNPNFNGTFSDFIYLEAGDYLELWSNQWSSGAHNITGDSARTYLKISLT